MEEAIGGSLTRGENSLADEQGTERADAIERPLSAVSAKPRDPAHLCGSPTKRGRICRLGKGAMTRHGGFGHCKYHGGNTPNGEAFAEKQRQVAERAKVEVRLRELAKDGNIFSELEMEPGDPDGVASLKKALRLAEWRENGLRRMLQLRPSVHGVNHLLDQAEDIVSQMHAEAISQVAKIAKDLASVTTGTKVTVENRFAVFAQYSDDELDAAIAEAESIVSSARKGEAA